jgi:hypothetical protein
MHGAWKEAGSVKELELARRFYFTCVRPIIAEHVPEVANRHAAGLVGYGSGVLGNDDELSRDHEWGPRLYIFLDKAMHATHAQRLDGALAEFLPASIEGFPTRFSIDNEIAVMSRGHGTVHHVVITWPERFLELTVGVTSKPSTNLEWLLLNEQRLLELTRGEIFVDHIGDISRIRSDFEYFPEEIWKYKLAYLLATVQEDMITLCGRRGDVLAMHMSVGKSVERIIKICFVLNRKYCPYEKWIHREFIKLQEHTYELEPCLRKAFLQTDHASIRVEIDRALEIIAGALRSADICSIVAADKPYHRGALGHDFQQAAMEILGKLTADLSGLSLNRLPLGAVDQWIANADILMSPNHIQAARSIYLAKGKDRDRFGDSLL